MYEAAPAVPVPLTRGLHNDPVFYFYLKLLMGPFMAPVLLKRAMRTCNHEAFLDVLRLALPCLFAFHGTNYSTRQFSPCFWPRWVRRPMPKSG